MFKIFIEIYSDYGHYIKLLYYFCIFIIFFLILSFSYYFIALALTFHIFAKSTFYNKIENLIKQYKTAYSYEKIITLRVMLRTF